MRVLIIHNQLWAHYKSKLFTEIHECMKRDYPQSELLVAHIALKEASRGGMSDDHSYTYQYPYKVLFNRNLDQVGFVERLRALISTFDTFKPTILNVTGWFDWAQVLLMAYAKSKGVKVVLSSESSSMDHNRSGIKEAIKKKIVGMADTFFCFGKTSVDYLLSLGIKPSQIAVDNAAVIDETVIQEKYNKAKVTSLVTRNRPTFAFVGRLAPEKNLDMLLGCFMKLQDEEPLGGYFDLLFVGTGPEEEHLKKIAAKSTFPQNIQFSGGVAWYQVPEWLAKSDVVVLPSTSEPWGLVINEAMVCGMPVIVSQACGCAEDLVKNGVNGYIFDPQKPNELEKALYQFIQNPDQINSMGIQSKELIKRFDSVKVAAEMVRTYHQL